MFVLHAIVHQHTIGLWAEWAPRPVWEQTSPARHPGALQQQALRTLLEQLPLNTQGQIAKVLFFCPSSPDGPLSSHPLLGETTAKHVELAGWQIDCCLFSPFSLLPWLASLPSENKLQEDMLLGAELHFLQHLLRWAARLVAEQQFLPALEGQAARWQAYLSPKERLLLPQWSQALPACLFADAGTQPEPARLLENLLNLLVDGLIRQSRPQLPEVFNPSTFDLWLQALKASQGTLKRKASSLTELQTSLQQWREPLNTLQTSDWQLGLQVHDPEISTPQGKARWRIQAYLQSLHDPSLHLPLSNLTQLSPQVVQVLGTNTAQLQAYLLVALGQASAIFKPLQKLLKTPQVLLNEAEIWQFLAEAAPLLEQAGFALRLPTWWLTPQNSELSLSASFGSVTRAGLNLNSLLQVNWELALGENKLTPEELALLAQLKHPLVLLRGQWQQVDLKRLQKALAFLRTQPTEQRLKDVLPLALNASNTPLPVRKLEARGKLKTLLDQLQGKKSFALTPVPDSFAGSLRPYQLRGVSWLEFMHTWGLGTCLADDMGLGKTPQTLARILKAREAQPKSKPVLLICPTTLLGNWKREAAKFSPGLKMHLHHGAERPKEKAFQKSIAGQDLVITSYGLLYRDIDFLSKVPWQGVVLDEAQAIKNPDTQQARAARALDAQWRVALTGTPLENHVGDLWSLMEFLNPGLLGSQASFKRQFQQPIQERQDPQALQSLKARLEPFLLRREKTDKNIIADLPDKLEMEQFCPLTREQATLYQAELQHLQGHLRDSHGIQRKGLVLAALTHFKQICNHPAQFLKESGPLSGRSGKLQRLLEMLTEVREMQESALIFSQFASMGELLQDHLQEQLGEEVLLLTGSTPKKQRDQMVERYQAGEGPGLFILSLKAGGTGLNLTRANHVFHFDRWWNPAVENQATDRAFRIGQTRNVQVHKFVCSGTLEERIAQLLTRKQTLADQAVGSGENWLTELSNEQLHELLALNLEEALAE